MRVDTSMIKIFKLSDLSNLLPIPLLFTAFFLVKPVFAYFEGAEADWWEGLPGLAAIVTIVLAVYFAVICLRIRDHWRDVASSETSGDE